MSRWNHHRVAVMAGGRSGERDVSLRSGAAIHKALLETGHDATLVDAAADLQAVLEREKVQVVYNGLHGRWGEDGCVQGLLEWIGLPYTGSGVEASAIAMDKVLTKQLAAGAGVPTPKWIVPSQWGSSAIMNAIRAADLSFPLAVKPNREGSSLGFQRIADEAQLAAWTDAMARGEMVPSSHLIEAFRTGREMTVAVLDGQPLPLVEIRPRSGVYDYQSKYTSGASEYFCPAPVTEQQRKRMQDHAVAVHLRLDCRGATRSDFILDEAGQPWFLEINTLPGMTATSLLPKAAAASGMDFNTLVGRVLDGAALKGM